MPRAEVVAVIPLVRIACRHPEVLEVSARARRQVLVVADRWERSILMTSPGRVVTVCELFRAAYVIGVVAEGEYGAGDLVEKASRRLGPTARAFRDVSRTDQHLVIR